LSDTTAKHLIPFVEGTDLIDQYPLLSQDAAERIDDIIARYEQGLLGDRPAATISGRLYRATDTDQAFLDTGSAWEELARGSSGKSIVATEEGRTNTAYGSLATPDSVTVVVPASGLLEVASELDVKESVANAASVALIVAGPAQSEATGLQSAGIAVGSYGGLQTAVAIGLQPVQLVPRPFAPSGGNTSVITWMTLRVPAGSITVSLAYKASSGTVTARNRKLWVRVVSI